MGYVKIKADILYIDNLMVNHSYHHSDIKIIKYSWQNIKKHFLHSLGSSNFDRDNDAIVLFNASLIKVKISLRGNDSVKIIYNNNIYKIYVKEKMICNYTNGTLSNLSNTKNIISNNLTNVNKDTSINNNFKKEPVYKSINNNVGIQSMNNMTDNIIEKKLIHVYDEYNALSNDLDDIKAFNEKWMHLLQSEDKSLTPSVDIIKPNISLNENHYSPLEKSSLEKLSLDQNSINESLQKDDDCSDVDKTLAKQHLTINNLYLKYDDEDPMWILESTKTTISNLWRGSRDKYYISPNLPKELGMFVYPVRKITNTSNKIKIAIVGDFGTGDIYQETTFKSIIGSQIDGKLDAIIHLGDIYYTGLPSECENFWNIIEKNNINDKVPFWAIPGNHEYFCQGQGYFGSLINKKRLGDVDNKVFQERSYFSLEDDILKIQILALDTGYKSSNIPGEISNYSTNICDKQLSWAQNRLSFAKNKGYKTILLTHHPLFSAYWKYNPYNKKLRDEILTSGQDITLWAWGHEHRMTVYNGSFCNNMIHKCICAGNGAMPEHDTGYYELPNEALLLYPNRETRDIDYQYTPASNNIHGFDVYNHGFLTLDIDLSDNKKQPNVAVNVYEIESSSTSINNIKFYKKGQPIIL